MERRQECWYSIIRFCADDLTGEIINVGILMHLNDTEPNVKFLLLDEHSPKLKAISYSQTDLNIYKSFKDSLDYYLQKSVDNIFGKVGEITIATPLEENFLNKLYDHYENKKMTITRPTFSFSKNPEMLFKNLFETYIGKKYYITEHKEVSVKKYLKEIFEQRNLLDKKIAHDFKLTPIKHLENLRINIDFGFKNGVWNYMQTVPTFNEKGISAEWLAKVKFMFDNLEKDAKVHLLFRSSDISNREAFYGVIHYFSALDKDRIFNIDLDDESKIIELCNTIERDAHDNVEQLLIS